MQLIYRGYTYNIQAPVQSTVQSTVQPHVINWRYRVADSLDELAPIPPINHCPRSINWRYQLAAMA